MRQCRLAWVARHHWVRVLVTMFALCRESTAHAAKPTIHAVGSVSLSYSDNVLGAPDEPGAGAGVLGPKVADVALQFAPGAALLYEGQRAKWAVSYSHPMALYLLHAGAHGSGDEATFLGMFTLSPEDELTAKVSLSRTSSTISALGAAHAERGIGAVRTGSTMFNVAALHGYNRTLNQTWALHAGGGASFAIPQGGGAGMFAGTWDFGPRVVLPRHLLGLGGKIVVTRPLTSAPRDNGFAADEQLVVGAEARWGWDWTERWSSQVTGGVVSPVAGSAQITTSPIGSAAIRFDAEEGYAASLQWARGFVPNVLTGQTYFSDTISLSATLPIYKPAALETNTSTGFAWSRIVDSLRGIDTDTVKTAIVDVSVGWYPKALPRVALAYQYTRQFDAPAGQVLLHDFGRHIVSLTMEYMFPARKLRIAKGEAQRADGSDRPKVGE